MTPLDIFFAFVLISLLLTAVAFFIVLAQMPGRVAKEGRFARSRAINAAGWAGALILGALGIYFFALQ